MNQDDLSRVIAVLRKEAAEMRECKDSGQCFQRAQGIDHAVSKIEEMFKSQHQTPFDRQHTPKPPRAFIQWKGVCMDFHCTCGGHFHLCELEFIYHVRCVRCKRTYMTGCYVDLVLLDAAEVGELEKQKTTNYMPWRMLGYECFVASCGGHEHEGEMCDGA